VNILAVSFYQSPWFQAALIVLAAIVVARIVNAVLARREAAARSLLGKALNEAARTRYVMVRRLAQTTIIFVGAAFALAQFPTVQLVAGAMLTSVAIIAAIVGIAARAPLANFVSGVMIAFSQPVRLGDYISINDVYGTVEEITLTYTYVRTLDDHHVVIPNELFASTPVSNYSKGAPGSMVEVSFSVPLRADLQFVRHAALAIADGLAPAPAESPNRVEVQALEATSVTLRVSLFAADPLMRRELADGLRAALATRLGEASFGERTPGEE
jgi:small-conductance mechanosensitive channel